MYLFIHKPTGKTFGQLKMNNSIVTVIRYYMLENKYKEEDFKLCNGCFIVLYQEGFFIKINDSLIRLKQKDWEISIG